MVYDIDAVRRQYVGKEFARSRGRYPVEYDPIRRHCHMVEDRNPLFLDPDYAARSRHGAVICPPSGWLAMYFASLGPWPPVFEPLVPVVPAPGKRIVNMGQEVEWFDVIRVGDHLSVVRRIIDVYQKAISIDPEAVWVVTESVISNQRDQVICSVRNTLLFHRTPEEVAAARKVAAS
ncbi:MAG TPA: MaoC family dehydratase N-terminal domain-containing protein [Dehalococcoidia bacterium]|nr:MaoC family dehydratase N-terminal domain-containing protein [Dehalococcoidia bacterium]